MVKKEVKCCNCGEVKEFCCCTPIGTLCKACLDYYSAVAERSIRKIEKTENETDLMEKLGEDYEAFCEERDYLHEVVAPHLEHNWERMKNAWLEENISYDLRSLLNEILLSKYGHKI
jgi:hypothetical protein